MKSSIRQSSIKQSSINVLSNCTSKQVVEHVSSGLSNGTLLEVLAGHGMVIEDSDYLYGDRFKTILRAYFRTTFNNVNTIILT